MTSSLFFFLFVPLLAFILLAINFIFAPHNPYQEKNGAFECGFTSFLGQNRTQFSISFFIFALLFLLFDLEILLVYPYLVSSYTNESYGLVILLIFLAALTLGFVFELGKKALTIDSRQTSVNKVTSVEINAASLIPHNIINNIISYIKNYISSKIRTIVFQHIKTYLVMLGNTNFVNIRLTKIINFPIFPSIKEFIITSVILIIIIIVFVSVCVYKHLDPVDSYGIYIISTLAAFYLYITFSKTFKYNYPKIYKSAMFLIPCIIKIYVTNILVKVIFKMWSNWNTNTDLGGSSGGSNDNGPNPPNKPNNSMSVARQTSQERVDRRKANRHKLKEEKPAEFKQRQVKKNLQDTIRRNKKQEYALEQKVNNLPIHEKMNSKTYTDFIDKKFHLYELEEKMDRILERQGLKSISLETKQSEIERLNRQLSEHIEQTKKLTNTCLDNMKKKY